MRVVLLLLIASGYLFWSGIQDGWTAVTNMSPQEISCHDYVTAKPSKTWLKLKGCYLDMTEASFMFNPTDHQITELFIPVRPVDDKESEKVHIMLSTKDPAMLKLAQKMDKVKTEEEAIQLVGENSDKIFQERDLEGMVRFGYAQDSSDRDKIANLDKKMLASDFVIFEEGSKPSPLGGILRLAGGVACLLLLGVMLRSRS